jgi:hypothetical protein
MKLGQGPAFHPLGLSSSRTPPHLPPAPCSTFPTGTQPSCQRATRRIRNRILHHVRRPRAPRRRGDVPTLRILVNLQGRRGLLRSLPYPPRRHLRAASCAGRRVRHHLRSSWREPGLARRVLDRRNGAQERRPLQLARQAGPRYLSCSGHALRCTAISWIDTSHRRILLTPDPFLNNLQLEIFEYLLTSIA